MNGYEGLSILDLNEVQSRIYLTVLEFGQIQTSTLASKCGLKRSTCYDICTQLIDRGILSMSQKGGVKTYAATHPTSLLEVLQTKSQQFATLVPLLTSLINTQSIKPKIKLFEGLEGIKAMYDDTLESEVEINAFIGTVSPHPQLINYLNTHYLPRRIAKQLHAKVLRTTSQNQRYTGNDHEQLRETRHLSIMEEADCEIDLYGPGKLMIALFRDKQLMGITIESQDLYKMLQGLFMIVRQQGNSQNDDPIVLN